MRTLYKNTSNYDGGNQYKSQTEKPLALCFFEVLNVGIGLKDQKHTFWSHTWKVLSSPIQPQNPQVAGASFGISRKTLFFTNWSNVWSMIMW